MSDSSHSRPEGQGYNSKIWVLSSPYISSSLAALAGSEQSEPIPAVPLNVRTTASPSPIASTHPPRCPLQPKDMRANIDSCRRELSEGDLALIRTRSEIPSSPPTRGSPSAASTPLASLQGFCDPLPSKLDPESWRPFFLFVSGGRLPCDVPSGFTVHQKSTKALQGSAKHKADSVDFTAFWANTRPMPLHFYSDPKVLSAVGLVPGTMADLGTRIIEGHLQRELRASGEAGLVVASSSSEEDEVMGPLLRTFPSLGFPSSLSLEGFSPTLVAHYRPKTSIEVPSTTKPSGMSPGA
ncbi:hypothetical protein LIER_10737 [Lithospermum erythrorhizon]|uniref:Uncharacterized protein n=1 Tax=Lithospermum erythrorhizon TaxID=34254 RepID=A0AAV3PN94_LITER